MNENRRIFKYPLKITDTQIIKVPAGASALSVINQKEIPVLYAIIPEDNDPEVTKNFEIRIYGTGHTLPCDSRDFKFLGTVPTHGGDLVWHVFYKDHGYWC